MNAIRLKYILMLVCMWMQYGHSFAQSNAAIKFPVFRQVSYPYLPGISSDYFFFSGDGLMWFSTAQGLTSFDGSGVIFHSNVAETNEYGLSNILRIAEDANHNLYIGSILGFVFFNRNTRQFLTLEYTSRNTGKVRPINAFSFFIDKDGTVFAGTLNQGLVVYHPRTKKMEHYNLSPAKPDDWEDWSENTVTSFLEYPGNNSLLWVGGFNGIYLFNKVTGEFKKNFSVLNPQHNLTGERRPYYDVEKMTFSNDSTIWFNIWNGGFAEYNTHTGKAFIHTQQRLPGTEKQVPKFIITSFTTFTDSLFVLGITNWKPAVFNIKTKSLQFFNVTDAPSINDVIRCVEKDTKGNIWLLRNGILYVSMPDYTRLQSKALIQKYSGKYQEEMRGIYFDSGKKKYYCAVRFSTGVFELDSNFNLEKIIPTPLFTNKYTYRQTCTDKITKDGSGRFWTTGLETYLMLPGRTKFEYIEKIFPKLSWIKKKAQFKDIVTTSDGNIILLESGTGNLYIINHKTLHTDSIKVPQFTSLNNNSLLESELCYDAARDVVYLANNLGIAQYHLRKKTIRVMAEKEIFGNKERNQVIQQFSMDDKGRLWILKSKLSIRIIDPEKLSCIDSILPGSSRGLMQAFYNSISPGGNGRMFLKTLNGIVVYDYKRNQSFLFDNTNGLQFQDVPKMHYSNFHLLMSRRNAITYYDLRQLPKNNFRPAPQLNSLIADTAVVFTRETGGGKAILLTHKQNTIQLSFSAPEFVFPERIEYAYLLEGVNKNWQYAGYFNRRVNYDNLSPGKYIFHLKAQMQGGGWNATEKSYTIIVQAAWWQTQWFSVLAAIALIFLTWILIKWRIKTARRQEQFKTRHEKELLQLEARALRTQMNPHFIFNCLNSIKSLIQEDKNEKSVTYLTTFSKLIRTLFQNADKKEITLFDEIETCRLYLQLESMRFDSGFSYTLIIENNLDLKSIQVPALIIQPFIENAIWHGIIPRGTGGNIQINVTSKNGIIKIVVEDDGIGREVSQLNKSESSMGHHSKGVYLTQSRLGIDNLLRQRNAKIDIIDKKDEAGNPSGTKAIITLNEEA